MGVRKVRDSAYWGMPVGTPITKGTKPVRARDKMAAAVKSAASPNRSKATSPTGNKVPGLLSRNAAANPPKPSSRGTAAQRMAASRQGGAWAAMAAVRKTSSPKPPEPSPQGRLLGQADLHDDLGDRYSRAALARVRARVGDQPANQKPTPQAPVAAAPAKAAKQAAEKATTARDKFAAGASSRMPNVLTPSDAITRLRGMNDRASGEQLLAKASWRDLVAIADAGNIPHRASDNKTKLRTAIIEQLIGRRADSQAITRVVRGGS